MLTLARCREILGADCGRSDAELERLRNHLQALAELTVEACRISARAERARDPQPRGDGQEPNPRGLPFAVALQLVAEDQRHDVEERAAIMQYDGGLDRDHAERRALLQITGATREKARRP